MKHFLAFVFILCTAASAWAQPCAFTPVNNGQLIIDGRFVEGLAPGDRVLAYGAESGCVGVTDVEALDFALTVSGDDHVTPGRDGLMDGEPFSLYRLEAAESVVTALEHPSMMLPLEYKTDAIWRVTSAQFDTTTTELLAELSGEITALAATVDSLVVADSVALAAEVARGDNLQRQLDNVAPELAAANARVAELEAELATANTELDRLVSAVRAIVAFIRDADE